MRVEGSDDFKRAAHELSDLGDRQLRLATGRSLRAVAKPLGESMVHEGAARLPRAGGLAARVDAASVSVLASLGGRNPRVVIRLKTREGYRLKQMDEGNLRHPVFARDGRKPTWVRQTVPGGGFTRAFQAGASMVRRRVSDELQRVLDEAARKV